MALLQATNKQIPDHSILDRYNKQTYLGNQYVANLASTVGMTETPILLLNNATSGAGPTQIAMFQNLLQVVSLTAGDSVILKVYSNPTVTSAGTPLAPVNARTAYGNNSVATLTSAPSVSANGSLLAILTAQALVMGISERLTILDASQSLLITATASAASTSVETVLGWYEL